MQEISAPSSVQPAAIPEGEELRLGTDLRVSGGHQPVTRIKYPIGQLVLRALATEVRMTLRDLSGYTKLLANLLVLAYNVHWFVARNYYSTSEVSASVDK